MRPRGCCARAKCRARTPLYSDQKHYLLQTVHGVNVYSTEQPWLRLSTVNCWTTLCTACPRVGISCHGPVSPVGCTVSRAELQPAGSAHPHSPGRVDKNKSKDMGKRLWPKLTVVVHYSPMNAPARASGAERINFPNGKAPSFYLISHVTKLTEEAYS